MSRFVTLFIRITWTGRSEPSSSVSARMSNSKIELLIRLVQSTKISSRAVSKASKSSLKRPLLQLRIETQSWVTKSAEKRPGKSWRLSKAMATAVIVPGPESLSLTILLESSGMSTYLLALKRITSCKVNSMHRSSLSQNYSRSFSTQFSGSKKSKSWSPQRRNSSSPTTARVATMI